MVCSLFILMIYCDDVINVDVQLVGYVFSYFIVGILVDYLLECSFISSFYFVFCSFYINVNMMMSLMWKCRL